MDMQDVRALQQAGQLVPTNASRAIILRSVAQVVRVLGPKTFKSLVDVEFARLKVAKKVKIGGTVLELVATAAEVSGIAVGDPKVPMRDRTVGDVMRSKLGLSRDDINDLACRCVNGDEMSADRAANNLDYVAGQST